MLIDVRGVKSLFAGQLGGPLPEEDGEGNVVEDNSDVECADQHVDYSSKLVEASSGLEFDILTGEISLWWMV